MNIARFFEVSANPSIGDYYLVDKKRDTRTKLELVDDYGINNCEFDSQLFVFGNEFGPTHLVCARNECEAFEAYVDSQPTILPEEVHEAYGAYDKLIELLEDKNLPGTYDDRKLREFANRWAPVFFRMMNPENSELLEGYHYQSNSSGTGIVELGHYTWFEPATRFEIEVE